MMISARIFCVSLVLGVVFFLFPGTQAIVQAAGCDGNNIIFSEIDYDQPSTDNAEFIELRIKDATTVSHCELRLVNGLNSSVYSTIDLAGIYSANKYLLIGGTGIVGRDITIDGTCASNCVQNDAEGLALVDTSGAGTLVWFISYEGQITNYDPGDGSLNSSANLPVSDSNSSPNRSLINGPTLGLDDVVTTQTPTPGAANKDDAGSPTAITLRGLSARSGGAGLPVMGLALAGLLVGAVVVRRK